MALIEWSASLSVGINEIDDQHKVLIGLINRLNEAMKTGQGKAALGAILKETADYTASHFAVEENYMTKFNYTGLARHKIEHKSLIDQVLKLAKDFDSGKITITMDAMTFLKEWLAKHIQGTDKLYVSCFTQNGVK